MKIINISLVVILIFPNFLFADDNQKEYLDWERWFEEDFEEQIDNVNEGELKFLATPPTNKPATHSIHNVIRIDEHSLSDYWVSLTQCHHNLDAVARTQIVYPYREMRNLRITSKSDIVRAWVEQKTVQLEDIKSGAKLCIAAEAKILMQHDGLFSLKNGPYYRRFLDGYYPFHITFRIEYPQSLLTLLKLSPQPQAGVTLVTNLGQIDLDAWFEGKLLIVAIFASAKEPASGSANHHP